MCVEVLKEVLTKHQQMEDLILAEDLLNLIKSGYRKRSQEPSLLFSLVAQFIQMVRFGDNYAIYFNLYIV